RGIGRRARGLWSGEGPGLQTPWADALASGRRLGSRRTEFLQLTGPQVRHRRLRHTVCRRADAAARPRRRRDESRRRGRAARQLAWLDQYPWRETEVVWLVGSDVGG